MSSNTVPEYYSTCGLYIQSKSSMEAKITAIEAVETALETAMLDAAGTAKFSEYSLDDGQTKIRAVYKDAAAIIAQLKALDSLKQIYINRINGRHSRLVDEKNFLRRC